MLGFISTVCTTIQLLQEPYGVVNLFRFATYEIFQFDMNASRMWTESGNIVQV